MKRGAARLPAARRQRVGLPLQHRVSGDGHGAGEPSRPAHGPVLPTKGGTGSRKSSRRGRSLALLPACVVRGLPLNGEGRVEDLRFSFISLVTAPLVASLAGGRKGKERGKPEMQGLATRDRLRRQMRNQKKMKRIPVPDSRSLRAWPAS